MPLIEAILHGKVSSRVRRQEDVLTSAVFGLLSFLSWTEGLGPWLADARRLDGRPLGDTPPGALTFWPTLGLPTGGTCQPDVVVTAEERVVFIECKLFSGPSGQPTADEADIVRGQLGRQWIALRHGWQPVDAEAGESFLPGSIVYLTADWVIPRSALTAVVSEVESKTHDLGLGQSLYWLSWRRLEGVLRRHPAASVAGRRVQSSLGRLLAEMDLVAFDGCEIPAPASKSAWAYTYALRAPAPVAVNWNYGGDDV